MSTSRFKVGDRVTRYVKGSTGYLSAIFRGKVVKVNRLTVKVNFTEGPCTPFDRNIKPWELIPGWWYK